MPAEAAPEIVLVDDSELDAYFLGRWLSRSALPNALRAFPSGQHFLDHMVAVQTGTTPMPALVLMDINMPEASGFEVVRSLRSLPAFREAPEVVFYSNSDSPLDRRRAEELGAGFVEKFSSRAEALEYLDQWRSSGG
jgi:CheY-like chemotaxis protein